MGESASTTLRIEIHYFHCGQGDTILVNVQPGGAEPERWVLVDCNLGDHGKSWERFIEFVERRRIRRLDLVIQTHADIDHFRGMLEVLRYFNEEGRGGVGCYIDGGLDVKQVWATLRQNYPFRDQASDYHSRYARLQDYLVQLARDEKLNLRLFDVDGGSVVLSENPDAERPEAIEIIPLFPSATAERVERWKQVVKLGKNPDAALDSNALALVFAIRAQSQSCEFQGLFTSDADAQSVRDSLGFWVRHLERPCAEFDLVKLPHHGSYRSHSEELKGAGRNAASFRVAAVTCGDGAVLPDSFVLREFLSEKWRIFSTTTRRSGGSSSGRYRRYNLPFELLSWPARSQSNVEVEWSPGRGMNAGPPEAEVRREDLRHYGTAR